MTDLQTHLATIADLTARLAMLTDALDKIRDIAFMDDEGAIEKIYCLSDVSLVAVETAPAVAAFLDRVKRQKGAWRICRALAIAIVRAAPCLHDDCSGPGGDRWVQCKRCAALEGIGRKA